MSAENVKILTSNTEAIWAAQDALATAVKTAYEKYPELQAIEDAESNLQKVAAAANNAAVGAEQPTWDEYMEALNAVSELHPEWSDKIDAARQRLNAAKVATDLESELQGVDLDYAGSN